MEPQKAAPLLFDEVYRNAFGCASLGMRQSPRGERATLPMRGPSGMQLRLNCCAKKRRMNSVYHFSMVAAS